MTDKLITETLAPDPAGPFKAAVTWQLLEGRWEAVGLALSFADESDVRPLHTVDLRKLRLPEIVKNGGVELRRQLAERSADLKLPPDEPLDRDQYRQRLLEQREAEKAETAAKPRGPGRPSTSRRELEEIAHIYGEAFFAHEPPTKAVAEGLGLTYSAAAKRIATCRKLGILGEAERGKAGGAAFLRRGDAASQRALIREKAEMAQRHEELAGAERAFIQKIRESQGNQAKDEG